MRWTTPAGWLIGWTDCADTGGILTGAGRGTAGQRLNQRLAYSHFLLNGVPSTVRVPVNVNQRDAGGNVNLTLVYATFAYGTLGDLGSLQIGGPYTVPRELGVAIAALGAGNLS